MARRFKVAAMLRNGSSNSARHVAHMLSVLEMQLEICHGLSWTSVVELAWAILTAYPWQIVDLVVWW